MISASSTAWCSRALFFPRHNLESHIIYLLWYYTLFPPEISHSSQQVGTNAERRDSQGHRAGCEGWNSPLGPAYQRSPPHSGAAALPHCRAVWGDIRHCETFRYYRDGTARWPEPGTFLKPFHCKCLHLRTAQLVTTTALPNLWFYEHQHIICSFILWLFRGSLSGSTVSIKHAARQLWLSW